MEGFNGTLKQMLRRMCIERPKNEDKYLPTVTALGYREVPRESLECAPFELMYDCTVRRPNELWS